MNIPMNTPHTSPPMHASMHASMHTRPVRAWLKTAQKTAQKTALWTALLVVASALALAPEAHAQRQAPDDASADGVAWTWSTDMPTRGVTLEVSALWPLYPGGLFLGRAALPVAPHGELLLGVQGRLPEARQDEGTFQNIDAQVGWRHALPWGLHVDGLLNVGWGSIRGSTLDGQDYDSLDVEVMALAGWRLRFGRAHLLLQPIGLGMVVFKSHPWPIRGQGSPRVEGPIYVGNVLLGWTF